MTAIEAFLELLAQVSVRYIFGNPGTTELPLNDALAADGRFQYILGLQEVPVMAMADGYAMASGQLGVVNLHACCGLGNAMGMLYNAYREGTPLLVTAGQQDRRLLLEEPILAGRMTDVAGPWTKWSYEVQRADDLPVAVRRAIQCALTPPRGPVFLSLPVDLQRETISNTELVAVPIPNPLIRPPAQAVATAVRLMREARQPAILAGSRVTEMGAIEALVRLAELWGAPVYSESGTTHGRLAFPADHPLNGQGLPLWSPEVRQKLAPFDVVLVTGMDLLRQYVYHEPARAIPEHIRLIHLDEDPWQLNKNYPAEVAIWGHTRVGLEELAQSLDQALTDEERRAAQQRVAYWSRLHGEARYKLEQQIRQRWSDRPMAPQVLMGALAHALPKDVAVIEEAVTTTNTTLERLGALRNTSGYFGHRGWALGWGLGCAVGVQLAWPDRPVLAVLGEGAALYGIVGLWSAAHYRLPVKIIICNNAQYQILKIGARHAGLPQAVAGRFVGMDLEPPAIDMVALAQSLGVRACRIGEPDELIETLRRSWDDPQPWLIDVPISRHTPPRLEYG
ncbi:MAG: benzoylformate decarboxylase [Pirellulaceae bacterium]|nr:MAG: benzoylformate decarboxylase [Pirellulaceae bacterium]